MSHSLPLRTAPDSNLEVFREDGDRIVYRGWRAAAGDERTRILAVAPAAEQTAPAVLDRLVHECELKAELDPAWAARPIELVHERGRTMLVLEDPGGEALDGLLGAPMEVGRFLPLAIAIVRTLGRVHQRGLVHKDIKPANILVDRASGHAWLTGFGIASRLPRERQSPEPPEFIAGTLAYMAPEQTGRMNRAIDSRSDLYSLGVTFYQMLTGALPFTAPDAIEWVHCHIARRPVPPSERLDNVPLAVSSIVMKLLAKTAEERYQTAAGLERDLRRCLAEWQARGRINVFSPGEHDTPDRLLVPEKLYGRAHDVNTLLAAFDRVVAGGAPELVLVSGYSGIGKSSVVNELHKVLVPPRGLFASGKFDQYKRDIPYSTLAQAFQILIRALFGKSDAELARWRDALREALGPNGRLIAELVPEMQLIIGDQPPVPELPPQQAQGRFQLVFQRFLGVFARPEHPLALFLDDLQWLDAATLDLLEHLLTRADLRHLLLIGAYRDNEVDAAHPLTRKLEAIRQAGAAVREITLAPLAGGDLRQLVADTLRCEPARAVPLAQLVHAKTAGNPFFTIRFLYTLAEEGLLAFDYDAARWTWDLQRIHAKGYTDNVVDLMVGKLIRMPRETQDALQQLACLGNAAEIAMLSIVLGMAEEQVHAVLWEAVRHELVERLAGGYSFVHDRVQEAAYSLIPQASRAAAHLRLGRLLVGRTPAERREAAVFEIVNQLNRGAALITSQDEREQLAELNLIAGKRAKASTAYASALTYLAAAGALLGADGWERRHELNFALELNRAECEFLTGALVAAEERLNVLSTRAATTVERASVACLLLDLYTTLGQSHRALAVGLEYLRHLGVQWPAAPTDEDVRREYERFWSQLGDRTIEDLSELPLMTDPASLATMDVLTKMVPPASLAGKNLYPLAMCWAVNLSLERGNSDGSCATYVQFGCVVGTHFGDHESAYRFGRLGRELVARRGLTRFEGRIYMVAGCHLIPYKEPLRSARGWLRRGFDIASRSGDIMYMLWYRCFYIIENLLVAGDPLIEVQRAAEDGLAYARKMRFGQGIDLTASYLALVRTLRGLTSKFGSFNDEHFDEARIEAHLASNPNLAFAECRYHLRKLHAHFHAGDYGAAILASSRAERLHHSILRLLFTAPDYHFYSALSRAAHCDCAAAEERAQHLDALQAHYHQLQVWAKSCPANFENRAALVGAEIARLEGRDGDAMRLYEQAILSARDNGFVHNEAVADECASRFYRARGVGQIADFYLRHARDAYLSWGADGKVRQLDELYPQLKTPSPGPAPTSTIGAPVEHLDLATVIKVSQTVSGEMVLEKLIDALMRAAIQYAGAERGLLILPEGTTERVVAEATTAGDGVDVRILQAPVAEAALSESIVHYVVRTRERVILDNASAENPFSADPYIRQRHVRSVLCLPLITQSKLAGVLYLENNVTPGVFTPSRIAVLQLLASQAAISVENTRLYRDLEERESKIRRLVEANIIGIIVWNLEGEITDANDAFLRMVGYTREDLAGGRLRWTDLSPPELRARHAELLAQFKTTGTIEPWEREYFRKDGSRVPVLVGSAGFGERRDQAVSFVLDLTERKRAEQALRDSEERFRTLVQFSFDAYWETDAEHRFIRQEFQDGLADAPPPGSEIGKTRWEVPYLEPDEEAWRKHRETLDAHLPFRDFELARPTPDGGKRYVSVSGLPVFDYAGRFIGYRGVGRHITQRKRAEQALRDSEEQWRAVFENNPTMYFMLDSAGTIVSVNPFGAEQLGYRVDELVGRSVVTLFHEADRAAVMENAAACFQERGRTMSWEFRKRRKDGTIIWVRETGRAMTIKGQPILLIVCEDISERKQAQHLTQQWFENAPQGLTIIGRDYRFQQVNPVFARYWRIPAERLVGMHVAELRGQQAFEQIIKPRLDRCFTGEEEERQYAGWYNAPIGPRYFMMTYTPLRPRSEQVEAALVIRSDITDYELAAQALREAQAELAHMNRVTTMGQLTATIAHEVNQPIAGAVTNAQAALRWLRARPPDLTEVGQALARIVADGNRAGEVIRRIRALVKKAPAATEPVDINETISEVVALTRSEMLKNGVVLHVRLGAKLPRVRGDRVQLAQVILNFVVNAIEAMKGVGEGPRELLVTSERDASGGVLVSVRDSGPGLSPESQDRLFGAFYTTKHDGMGMGLSICRSIIEAHGGRVWASANLPCGAAFQFTLPATSYRGSPDNEAFEPIRQHAREGAGSE